MNQDVCIKSSTCPALQKLDDHVTGRCCNGSFSLLACCCIMCVSTSLWLHDVSISSWLHDVSTIVWLHDVSSSSWLHDVAKARDTWSTS